jgi:hypothetical protein
MKGVSIRRNGSKLRFLFMLLNLRPGEGVSSVRCIHSNRAKEVKEWETVRIGMFDVEFAVSTIFLSGAKKPKGT